ncbi:MAG: hypothetical protein WBA68_00400 [Alteraurantiacibacter sp.]
MSALDLSQNADGISWDTEKSGSMLLDIMDDIHARCVEHGEDDNGNGRYVDYVKGANIAGFRKVADAMLASGMV